MSAYIVCITSTCISLVSLIFTILALLICVTQQTLKKRDGVLLFNIFIIDVLFSCIVAATNIVMIHGDTIRDAAIRNSILANSFVFIFLLSWASQCLIAVNRYVVIIFPFSYKKILSRLCLCLLVALLWVLIIGGCISSTVLASNSTKFLQDFSQKTILTYQFNLVVLSSKALMAVIALHTMFLVVIFLMECYLWKIARGHQSRYRSITLSVSNKEEDKSNTSKPNLENKRLSITQSLQKRFSLSTPKMAVRRTPFLLLGAHFSAIIPYCVVAVLYVFQPNVVLESKPHRYVCMFLLVANSVRPIINVFHHISSNKMKRFKVFLQMLFSKKSELCTEYYIENHKEVENMFRLRRESAHSIVTEGSVV